MLPNGLELGIVYDPLPAKDYVCAYIDVGCSNDPKDLADTMNSTNITDSILPGYRRKSRRAFDPTTPLHNPSHQPQVPWMPPCRTPS